MGLCRHGCPGPARHLSTLLGICKFENNDPGKIAIDIIPGESERVLSRMRDGLFDFIDVDGDHKYEPAKRKLIDAKRLTD
jgi:hypothetical protein